MTAVAPTQRVHRELRVIGSDLQKLMSIGAMLQSEFAYAGLVHTANPMARAATDAADVTIVLLDKVCSLEDTRAAVLMSRALVVVLEDRAPDGHSKPRREQEAEAPAANAAVLQKAGALVAPSNQPALLQAIVASLAAQVVVPQ